MKTPLSSWLDGTDEAEEGIWVDGAGNNITFFNWRGDQPDNKDDREHYLHYRPGWGGLWNDHDGGNVDHIVCQKEPTGETLFFSEKILKKKLKVPQLNRQLHQQQQRALQQMSPRPLMSLHRLLVSYYLLSHRVV